jgi:hypothetical protein
MHVRLRHISRLRHAASATQATVVAFEVVKVTEAAIHGDDHTPVAGREKAMLRFSLDLAIF